MVKKRTKYSLMTCPLATRTISNPTIKDWAKIPLSTKTVDQRFKNQFFLEQIVKKSWAAPTPVQSINKEASTLKEAQPLVSSLKEPQLNRCPADSTWSKAVEHDNLETLAVLTPSTIKIQAQSVLEVPPLKTLNASSLHQAWMVPKGSVKSTHVSAKQAPSTFALRRTCTTTRTKTAGNA